MNLQRLREQLSAVTAVLLSVSCGMVVAGAMLPSGPVTTADHVRVVSDVPPAAPVRLVVPRIGLKSEVVPIDMTSEGVLDPPGDVQLTGWWRGSAKPGEKTGQTLLTGHTVHTGGGVMNDLGKVEVGDAVRVRTRKGVVHYEATKVTTYSREEIAEHAEELFGQNQQHRRLVLVTCTDWKDGVYRSNLVVFADPVRT